MKKFLACMLFIILSVQLIPVSASESTVWFEDDGTFLEAVAVAQMLKDLGLFQGKDTGFELEDALTRAEAAALTVRFLGEEETALSEEWEHPFSDVPAWADRYIGWLYQHDIARGISAKEFGAPDNITGEEYETLLLRALTDMQEEQPMQLYLKERYGYNPRGFTRLGALHTSYRALRLPYTREASETPGTVAQYLVDKGVFTAKQLGESILNLELANNHIVYTADFDGHLTRSVFGVQVAATKETNLELDEHSIHYASPYIYGYQKADTGIAIYQIDASSMQEHKIGVWTEGAANESISYIGRAQTQEIFVAKSKEGYVKTVFSFDGTSFEKQYDFETNAEIYQFDIIGIGNYSGQGEAVYLSGPKHVMYLHEENEVLLVDLPETTKFYPINNHYFVTVSRNKKETIISSYNTTDGSIISSFSVPQEGKDIAEWRDVRVYMYLPAEPEDILHFYGSAGYYLFDCATGILKQISDEIVTASDGLRYGNEAKDFIFAVRTPGEDAAKGDRIIRNTPAGEEILLGNEASHNLKIGKVMEDSLGIHFCTYQEVHGVTIEYDAFIYTSADVEGGINLGGYQLHLLNCYAADWSTFPEYETNNEGALTWLYLEREKERLTQIGLDYESAHSD